MHGCMRGRRSRWESYQGARAGQKVKATRAKPGRSRCQAPPTEAAGPGQEGCQGKRGAPGGFAVYRSQCTARGRPTPSAPQPRASRRAGAPPAAHCAAAIAGAGTSAHATLRAASAAAPRTSSIAAWMSRRCCIMESSARCVARRSWSSSAWQRLCVWGGGGCIGVGCLGVGRGRLHMDGHRRAESPNLAHMILGEGRPEEGSAGRTSQSPTPHSDPPLQRLVVCHRCAHAVLRLGQPRRRRIAQGSDLVLWARKGGKDEIGLVDSLPGACCYCHAGGIAREGRVGSKGRKASARCALQQATDCGLPIVHNCTSQALGLAQRPLLALILSAWSPVMRMSPSSSSRKARYAASSFWT
jgi:hypothetical protein